MSGGKKKIDINIFDDMLDGDFAINSSSLSVDENNKPLVEENKVSVKKVTTKKVEKKQEVETVREYSIPEDVDAVDDINSDLKSSTKKAKKKKEKEVMIEMTEINSANINEEIIEEEKENKKEEKKIDNEPLIKNSNNSNNSNNEDINENNVKEEKEEEKEEEKIDFNINEIKNDFYSDKELNEEDLNFDNEELEIKKSEPEKVKSDNVFEDINNVGHIDVNIDEINKEDVSKDEKVKIEEKDLDQSIIGDIKAKKTEEKDLNQNNSEPQVNEPKEKSVGEQFKESITIKHKDLPQPTKEGTDLLTKAETNQLSDIIDVFNENNGTAFSTKDIKKFLSDEFKHGKGETLGDQRESFKQAYTDFMKDAYANMLQKRQNMPPSKRQSLEDTQKDFDVFAKQVANMCKANGWMKKDYQIGPNGGLSAETVRKIQLDAVKNGPQNYKDFAERRLVDDKNPYDKIKDFSGKYIEGLDKIPSADKNGNPSPEAIAAVDELQALNNVHASRSAWFKIRHPQAYRLESKTLNDAQAKLESKGYDKEILNAMLKEKFDEKNDPITQANEAANKNIEDLYKSNKEQTRKFEEKVEREENEIRKQIKGIRKRIQVPEAADNLKEIVNPDKTSPRVDLNKEKTLTNEVSMSNNK